MAKMREVNKKSAKSNKNSQTLVPIEINGQLIMMKVCKPNAAPKGLTARCQG